MATATMGLRRRIPVNSNQLGNASGSSSSNNSPSGYTTSVGSTGNKRSRSENNNSPSHGNLNSMNNGARDEPPTKKSRGTSTNSKNSGNFVTTNDSHPKTGGRGHFIGNRSKTSNVTASDIITSSSNGGNVLSSWSTTGSSVPDTSPYASVTGLSMTANSDQSSNNNTPGSCNPASGSLCSQGTLGISTTIPYMSSTMATFVGNATNLVGKNSSAVSYLDISNMTSGSLGSGYGSTTANSTLDHSTKNGLSMPFSGIHSTNIPYIGGSQKGQGQDVNKIQPLPKKFQNDGMFNAYQPWVIKTYGDLAKTKTITIKKYARILRTLRGEEVNSAENSKFRFWVKSKGFNIGQPEGYDAKPADRIIGRHAVTSPGLDPPLYVPTQLPHNKTLNGAEGTVPPGKVYKKVAIVENFFDIIHAVHVDLEGRPGKHAGQKRTYRTITETYAFLPREAVTRFLLGCTECQRRPRTPSPTNLANQQAQSTTTGATTITTSTPTSTIANPVVGHNRSTSSPTTTLSNLNGYNPKNRTIDAHHQTSEVKNLFGYRHQRYQQKTSNLVVPSASEKLEIIKETEEKYNPLSITNLLKKEPTPLQTNNYSTTDTTPTTNTTTVTTALTIDSRRTPESDRASSKSSASSKRRRMLPEGRTPSPQPNQPLPRPWSPGLDPKNTPVDYSLPITTSYLKHQQKLLLQAERDKAAAAAKIKEELELEKSTIELDNDNLDRFSPAAGLIDTNLNLLATIQHLHCQVMLALTERLRPTMGFGAPLILPSIATVTPKNLILGPEFSVQTADRS